jgi:predicted neutral ceramidase superfamily lipid hydrolase
MLSQKVDAKTSLWMFTCLVVGFVLAPMIVGGASKDWLSRLTVVAAVALASAILGAVVKSREFAVMCSVMLTWPALGYSLLVLVLRAVAPDGGASHTSASIVKVLLFAVVMMLLAPAVTMGVRMVAGPRDDSALAELAARVKLEA